MNSQKSLHEMFQQFRRLQEYVGWTEADTERIRNIAPMILPAFDGLVHDFYSAIQKEPNANKVITGGPEQIGRLKITLRKWLTELFQGPYDEDYVARRWQVGWRHVEIGLGQVYTNAALSRLRRGLLGALEKEWADRTLGGQQELMAAARSLNVLLDLDLAIIQDAYETEYVQRREEAQRRRSEAMFRDLVEAAGCMIVILRADHTVAYFNPFAEKLTGYSSGEVVGRDYLSLFLKPTQRQGVAEEADPFGVGRILAGGAGSIAGSLGYENSILHRDGSQRWMVWNARRLDDYGGAPAVLAVGHDITQRRHAEEQLRLLHTAIVDLAEGILITDAQLEWPGPKIVFVNPAMTQITGYTAEEFVGQTPRVLQGRRTNPQESKRLKEQLSAGCSYSGQNTNYRKDGSEYDVELQISPVYDASGKVINYVSVHHDVTRQKRAEERVRQAERLAAIGETVAGLAHESRNAFQRSQACLEMLALEVEDQPEQMELVERIQRALNHVHHLYEEVRDYAAPINLACQACDLSHVWRDAWNDLQQGLEMARKDKQVNLREQMDPKLGGAQNQVGPTCQADWFQMSQVFRNIFENAISACPNPGEIVIRCKKTEYENQPAVEIVVADNGPGIAPEAKDRVFDAFFTTKPKGTGLGMAIARRIVEAHGGRIAVGKSTAGAEIVITMPMEKTVARLSES